MVNVDYETPRSNDNVIQPWSKSVIIVPTGIKMEKSSYSWNEKTNKLLLPDTQKEKERVVGGVSSAI